MRWTVCTCVLWCLGGCAGDLEDPGRFDGAVGAVVLDDGGTADGATGGGDGDGDGTGGGVSNANVPACVTTIIAERCGSQFCHAAGEAQIDLVSDGLEMRLVDGAANADGACAGNVFISSSGGPSLLLTKVSDPNTCGTPMPVSGGLLSEDQIACIESWVTGLGSAGRM